MKTNAAECRSHDSIAHNISRKAKSNTPSSPTDRLHASSTVNANHLSVYPFTILGGKEADDTGNVDRLANTHVW